ncbi:MAG: type II secretion system secretin GspD [Candidatus Hydrogenedentes bacterium]|nr:type II secretion system secretin GspD [Candidatus Hydrogenedentota bacterium]
MQSSKDVTHRETRLEKMACRPRGRVGVRWMHNGLAIVVLATLAWPMAASAQQPGGQGADTPTLEEMANPDRPRGGDPSQEPFYLDFDDVPLGTVIRAIGVKTGRNFVLDPGIGNQKVTIVSHDPVPAELAYDILESILAGQGFTMLETLDGNLIRIVPRTGQQGTDKLHIYKGTIPPLDGFDRFSIHVVQVQYADASEIAELLKRVGSESNEITVYQQTNLLVIKDTADGVRNMMTLLETVDIPGTGTSVEIFTLEFTRAEALAQQIQDVLLGDGGTGGARAGARSGVQQRPAPARVRQPRTAVGVPGQTQAQIIGQGEEILRMVPDERLNALIVVASAGLMEQTRFLIEQLDTPTPSDANNMFYVELLNADAEEVLAALEIVTSTAPRQGGQQGGQTSEVQPFEKDIVIASYEQTNALIILAAPQDFKLLKSMIDHLDVPRRQVNVEAVIMEVTINDSVSLSVDLAGLTSSDFFALSNATTIATALAGGPLSLAGAGGTLGIIGSTIEIPDPLGTGGTISIPTIPFLMRSLEQITDVEVLSRPNLLASDNTEASITVGQDIPIVASLSDTTQDQRQGGGFFSSRSQVRRRDVGVTMSVTPQINEGDYVSMKIEVEVSSAVEATVVISDLSQGGATIQQALIKTEVVVGDGQTGIIGGLIRESRTGSISQVPVLGDLPLFGWLFRNKSKVRSKQNLVVLLTPHVLKRTEDFERITKYRLEDFYYQNLDAVFEKGGIVKTIKAKRKQRKVRPTDRYNPNRGNKVNFGRSNIQR